MRVTLFILFIFGLCLFKGATSFSDQNTGSDSDRLRSANNKVVRIGYFIAEPHIYIDRNTKKMAGAAYDLIQNHIAPETGIKFEWDVEPSSIPRQLNTLKHTKRFMSILLIFVPDRLKFSIFSSKSYFFAKTVIAISKNNPLNRIDSVRDLHDMIIGYSQNSYLSPFMRHPDIRFDLIANPDTHHINFIKLSVGRIDGVYIPGKAAMLFVMKRLNLLNEFKIIDLPETPVPYHIVFSKDLKETARRYDAAFEKLNGQQLYRTLLSKYIDISRM